jgi:hypothetical protein
MAWSGVLPYGWSMSMLSGGNHRKLAFSSLDLLSRWNGSQRCAIVWADSELYYLCRPASAKRSTDTWVSLGSVLAEM